MPTNKTFTMIKPDAVKDGHSGSIIKMIEAAGFRIVALKKTQLTSERAGEFYAVHKERPFYNDLCQYMSSGAIIPMILEKENAVRSLVLPTRQMPRKVLSANCLRFRWKRMQSTDRIQMKTRLSKGISSSRM